MATDRIQTLLADKAEYLLGHTCKTIDKSLIHVPSLQAVDQVWIDSDRNIRTLGAIA